MTTDVAFRTRHSNGQFANEITPSEVFLVAAPAWSWGGQQHGVEVVEAPSSDRAHNYYLTLVDGGFIAVAPEEFGLLHPEEPYNDQATLVVANDAGNITIEYAQQLAEDGLAGEADRFTAAERETIEREVADALTREFGGKLAAEFSGDQPWSEVKLVWTVNINGVGDAAGIVETTTSNVMAELETDEYWHFRATATSVASSVLASHGVRS
ncbi:hypothetical protein ACFVAJ_18555 [Agromyces sp. NPDC057679]|uniref:hypothetical protein n=1 Tax=Agromyces sp. NPDC057679 TaxID=3346207 RepID=UPI003672F7C3